MSEPTSHSRSSPSTTPPSGSGNGLTASDFGVPATAAGEDGNAKGKLEFVDWRPGNGEGPRKVAPRLHHKKSRLGCQQCRSRHVKCNEVHPTCGSCQRHGVTCVWGRPPNQNQPQPPSKAFEGPASSSKPTTKPNIAPKPSPNPAILPESAERRLLELRLLHQYMAVTWLTVNISGDPNIKEWSISVPRLALKHNSLLYSIYAFSALHLSREDPSFSPVWEQYLSLTLTLHREDVKNLSALNADAACLTASHLRICTFALLQSRDLEPYSPPLDWLSMSSLTGRGLQVSAWKYLKDDPTSINRRMVINAPGLKHDSKQLRDDESLLQSPNREKFLYFLHRTAEDVENEPWSESDVKAYEFTISYIGSIQRAIDEGEYRASIMRRVILFPMMVEPEFTDLVKLLRPRALAILAHYFTYVKDFSEFWWIGDTGQREANAIQRILPERWREVLTVSEGCWYNPLKELDLKDA